MNEGSYRVLIAEDDLVSSLTLRRLLESVGHTVTVAHDGLEAIELFERGSFRIVISDWMMPGLEGLELCRRIRASHTGYVYLILLTARGDREARLKAFDAGIDDILSKPLDREELLARLKVGNRILATEGRLETQKAQLALAGETVSDANRRLTLASRRFEELFEGLPVACFTLDEAGVVYEWNRTAASLFQVEGYEAFQRSVYDLFGGPSADLWNPRTIQSVFGGQRIVDREWVHTRGEGEEFHLLGSIFPIDGPNGATTGLISVNVDITLRKMAERLIAEQLETINAINYDLEAQKLKLECANQRLEHLAITDGLTGLRNHRFFQDTLRQTVERSIQTQRPLSVVLMDVDHFKQFNDTFGHPAGDVVLKKVSAILLDSAPEGATVARYGGEEFAIVLPETNSDVATRAAEMLRVAIERARWKLRKVTVSMGVATLDPAQSGEALPPKVLLNRADEALYASKRGGRNRVTCHADTGKNAEEAA